MEQFKKLCPLDIPQTLRQRLKQNYFSINFTYSQAIENLKSEDFVRIHNGLVSFRQQMLIYPFLYEELEDYQKEFLIIIIQQFLQTQTLQLLQFEALQILFQLFRLSNYQLQYLIKQISFQSLCEIYNRDSSRIFHVQIITILGLLSTIDESISFQIFKCCQIIQKIDLVESQEDIIDYLLALDKFCTQQPLIYKNLVLDFIKKKFQIIKNPESIVCKIAIELIKKLIKIPNFKIDEQTLNTWDEILFIWVSDENNILEGSLIELISDFIQKPKFPKEKIECQVFLLRLLQNLDQNSTFIILDSVKVYKQLIQQFQICILSEEFFKKLMHIFQEQLNQSIQIAILKVINQILQSEYLLNEYLQNLQKYNIIQLLPKYLDETIFIVEKLFPSSQLSSFFRKKQKYEYTFINQIMKIFTIILNKKLLLNKFQIEIQQFEKLFTQKRNQTTFQKIDYQKIQIKINQIIQLLENTKSFEFFETLISKKINTT